METPQRDLWASKKSVTIDVRQRVEQINTELQSKLLDEIAALARAAETMRKSTDFKDFYGGVDDLTLATRRLALEAHRIKTYCDWNVSPPPEFNDHFINLHHLMPEHRRTFWLEGAVFCGMAIEQGMRILELCCGGGFYTDTFYSPFASEIVAVDFDPRAIEMARRFHQRSNIRYEIADIRYGLPAGPFDAVIWDTAIEHFTIGEINAVLARLREIAPGRAPLAGYTVAEPADAPQHPDHETHFEGMDGLADVLKGSYRNVRVFERVHPTLQPARHNLFFYASDGVLPFDEEWRRGRHVVRGAVP